MSYDELLESAEAAGSAHAFIDPTDTLFDKPNDMPSKVQEACRRAGSTPPSTPGEIVRVVLESLARTYADALTHLEEVTGRQIDTIHIVGGGSRNRFLNQLTADATGRTVVAGPAECSATGNVLVQAIALGHIPSLAEARSIVRSSFDVITFHPRAALSARASFGGRLSRFHG